MKIYLKGAYGPGNLGDDVLMICMINVIKDSVPDCELYVGVEDPEKAKILHNEANFVDFKKPKKVDLLVYGGGGQFFDFDTKAARLESNILFKALNFIKLNKNPFWALNRLLYSRRENCFENLVISDKVALFAVGLGPFAFEGKGYYRLLKLLKVEKGFVSIRDAKSAHILDSINFKNYILGADPSFLKNMWSNSANMLTLSEERKELYDLSIICREWPYSEEGKRLIESAIDYGIKSIKKGKKVRFVFLYRNYDKVMIERLKNYDCLVYDPSKFTPSQFVEEISNHSKVIISSRAHGAWLPIIFGKPVIVLAIENKLKQVHNSLVNSTLIVEKIEDIHNKVKLYEEHYVQLIKGIKLDLKVNVNKSQALQNDFRDWLNEKF